MDAAPLLLGHTHSEPFLHPVPDPIQVHVSVVRTRSVRGGRRRQARERFTDQLHNLVRPRTHLHHAPQVAAQQILCSSHKHLLHHRPSGALVLAQRLLRLLPLRLLGRVGAELFTLGPQLLALAVQQAPHGPGMAHVDAEPVKHHGQLRPVRPPIRGTSHQSAGRRGDLHVHEKLGGHAKTGIVLFTVAAILGKKAEPVRAEALCFLEAVAVVLVLEHGEQLRTE